ncbi:hypothetical protein [Streptococcus oralis]|nr:hypothetical protein [Streptococcus mitis]
MASQEWLAIFYRFMRKNEHKETRIGYKIRILGQKVQPGIQNLFGNRRMKMEKSYNNYPDICVSKKDLKANYFPSISIKTIERRLDESQKTKEFKDISFRTGQKVLINVRGFYLFLLHRERVRYI